MKNLVYILILGIFVGCANSEKKNSPINSNRVELVPEPDKDLREKFEQEEDTPNFDQLIEHFNNPETVGRSHILYELNALKYPEIESLLETALDDENEYVRIIAIQSIQDNMQVESIDKLISIFRETENHTLVSNLTRTFVEFQLDKPISAIVEKLDSKE